MRLLPAAILLFVLTAAPQSDLTLVRTTEPAGDTHHVQGIDFDERRLWVTSVDKEQHKGYLQEFSLASASICARSMSPGATSIIPAAYLCPAIPFGCRLRNTGVRARAVVQKRSTRTLQLQFEFSVADHIGCVAAGPDFLIGANWDSRDFYIWDRRAA